MHLVLESLECLLSAVFGRLHDEVSVQQALDATLSHNVGHVVLQGEEGGGAGGGVLGVEWGGCEWWPSEICCFEAGRMGRGDMG